MADLLAVVLFILVLAAVFSHPKDHPPRRYYRDED